MPGQAPSAAPPPSDSHRRRRWALAVVVAGLVAAAALVFAVYWRGLRPEHHWQQALAALDAGRLDLVQRELADLESAGAYEPHRHFLRGALLLHARRFYPALDEFGHSVDHAELRVRTLTLSGAALYGLKLYQDAARLLAAAVEADPDAVDAHRWLASAYYDLGLTEQTLAELSRVAELAPADPHPHRLMGLMYKDFEHYDTAVERYRESLRRDANQAEREQILLETAECEIKLRRLDDALATLAQCRPSPQRWTKEAECHYQAGRPDEARPLLNQTLRQSPADLSALLLVGAIALEDGKAPVAVDAFLRATTAYPKDHVAHYKLSQAYRRLGNHALADQHARTAEELRKARLEFSKLHQTAAAEPGNADVRCRLGVLAGEVGRPDLARVWFQAALAIDPRHQETLRNLGGSALPPQQRGPDAARPQGGVPAVARPSEPVAGTASPVPAASPIRLHEVTEETGITFQHTDGSSGKRYIPETVTAGVALFDYDGDGRIDIYFPNGAPLPGTKVDKPPRHALYKNLGGWRFRDVTEEAGVACTGYGMGVAAADYDNDGYTDLYVSNFGPKVLYHNNGNGTFTDVTAKAGVADGNKVGAGACFLDIDGDGHLDLFVANYVKFTYDKHFVVYHAEFPEYAGPKEYPPDRQTLFRNRGDGTFSDVSVDSGIARHLGKGMGAVCADYDNDGRTDIFLLNDVFENFCFRNDGTGKFEEVALAAGFKYNGEGMPLGSMGVDCGDYDNDGRLDFFQTSYQRELPVLYRNLGNAFEDVTVRAGAGAGLNNVKWGCGFVDFDNDGHRDLFIGLGHLQDLIDQYDPTTSYRTRNIVLRNLGNGKFVDVSDQCGDGLLPKHSARGVAFEDLDNDGDVDVVILNSRERPTILRNMLYESGSKNRWLEIRLQGVKTNRDGVGARVRVVAGDLTQIDEVHSGRGYQSHWGLRLHFGLGQRDRVDRIEVRWIGGGGDVLENVPANQLLVITEGSSRG